MTLKSGGYLVINQTEALVAIDVNSGRSTREHNIEDTALQTNLEAADEVARQLRLRDLAGLIVIDFIDMEESRNNRAVERRLKEALKDDRARIQVGRISHFGLLEMSRQRIRTGVLEGSSVVCPHCAGAGTVRSTASVAVHVMRVLEDALIKSASHNIDAAHPHRIALYILNQKRSLLRLIEERFGVSVDCRGRRYADRQRLSCAGARRTGRGSGDGSAAPLRSAPADRGYRADRRGGGRGRIRRRRPRSRPPKANHGGDAARNAPRAKPAAVVVAVVAGAAISSARALASTPTRRSPPTRRWRRIAEIGGDLLAPAGNEEGEAEAAREGSEGRRRGRGSWRRRNRSRAGAETVDYAGDWRQSDEAAEGGDAQVETLVEASAETPFEPLPEWRPEASPESAPVTTGHVIHEAPASVEAPGRPGPGSAGGTRPRRGFASRRKRAGSQG